MHLHFFIVEASMFLYDSTVDCLQYQQKKLVPQLTSVYRRFNHDSTPHPGVQKQKKTSINFLKGIIDCHWEH